MFPTGNHNSFFCFCFLGYLGLYLSCKQLAQLLDRAAAAIEIETRATYDAVAARGGDIAVIIPPHVTAVPSATADHHPSQRDRHIAVMAARGRLGWQKETCYGRRSLVETMMGRYKAIIGPSLHARSLPGQCAEAAVGVAVLNRMLHAGRPNSVRNPGMPS